MALISSLLYVLPLLASLAYGNNEHRHKTYGASPNGTIPVSRYLNSFSIEFKDFPLFAGNRTHPNQFSINLLSNLASKTGVMPIIRIGGSTQDDAVFISSQTEPVITIGATNGTRRAPVTIGPSFFSSYGTFPSTSYIAGINLATNGSVGKATREADVTYISKALGSSLKMFEIGNEPDLFQHWNRRPSSWGISDYVEEWLNANQLVKSTLPKTSLSFFAPSFAGTNVGGSSTSMGPLPAFENGLSKAKNIKQLSGHNYMGSATGSGVSLQHTLMNHTSVVKSISNHVKLAQSLKVYSSAPYVMGETNSLSGGGATGLSDVFGAALWVVDYALWQATQEIQRVHFHESSTSPYAAWSPSTNPPTTNAPYYGNMMVAAAVGSSPSTSIAYLDVANGDDRISAYVLYEGDQLVRVVILNMIEYTSGTTESRSSAAFTIAVPTCVSGARVERLTAAGADVKTNITLGGVSYDYGLAKGKAVTVNATAAEEEVKVTSPGTLEVSLQDTEGVVLHLF